LPTFCALPTALSPAAHHVHASPPHGRTGGHATHHSAASAAGSVPHFRRYYISSVHTALAAAPHDARFYLATYFCLLYAQCWRHGLTRKTTIPDCNVGPVACFATVHAPANSTAVSGSGSRHSHLARGWRLSSTLRCSLFRVLHCGFVVSGTSLAASGMRGVSARQPGFSPLYFFAARRKRRDAVPWRLCEKEPSSRRFSMSGSIYKQQVGIVWRQALPLRLSSLAGDACGAEHYSPLHYWCHCAFSLCCVLACRFAAWLVPTFVRLAFCVCAGGIYSSRAAPAGTLVIRYRLALALPLPARTGGMALPWPSAGGLWRASMVSDVLSSRHIPPALKWFIWLPYHTHTYLRIAYRGTLSSALSDLCLGSILSLLCIPFAKKNTPTF